MLRKPPALPERATIAVVAPSSPPQTRSEIEQATAYFESRGHTVVLGPNHRKVHGYLAGTDAERAADLQWALSEPGIVMVLTVGEGSVEAPVVGGCLTLLCSSIGTPYEFDADGCILMVEDLNTEEYLVDTGINHLIRAGKLDNVAGFVFGTNVNLKAQTLPEGPESRLSIEELLDELIGPLGIPAVANVPTGHGKHMATLPLGVRARLDATGKTLEILEPAVAG